ncbi:glycosyltransferase family 8 protein [Dyadobacter pollutisoli]|jgi:lipopolysaccharide biosynthesis glycosyltransferase|uniref:Glycosyltransferase family 8 protein n=1 Tax=Dyadobacter pollutisoli TaxID=2910158 RepID=A0A9E8NFL9_9BACT|nr:glycosyltransferase family 8 protein [Dyadobacter pollutisoli]WAC13224.1 glycosyltransferase family 8 protein [Dyadobacter pollutisoli]
MNVVPIVYAFNYKVTMPAGVCFTSLLKAANPDTFYDIHIMHGPTELDTPYQSELKKLESHFSNCKISFINIGDMFDNVYVARGIPRLTYYKIVISDMIPQYDRVLFSDIDILYTGDLWEYYSKTDLDGYVIAAAKAAYVNDKYTKEIGCDVDNYVNCGFLLYNLKMLRENPQFIEEQKKLCGKKWVFFDQDIANIVFKGKIKIVSPKYNSTYTFFLKANQKSARVRRIYSEEEIQEGLSPLVIHYTGINPWQSFCPRHDIWWQNYRESIYYDQNYYYKHYYKLLNPQKSVVINQMLSTFLTNPIKSWYRKLKPNS